MKKLFIAINVILFSLPCFASGRELIDLAEFYYAQKNYYSSITESMRYQFLYPKGTLFADSMIIMGKSYYRGGDKSRALNIFSECYNRFTYSEGGERALFYSGLIRLESGVYYNAAKNFQEYKYVYDRGIFSEDVLIDLSIAHILAENYDEAENRLREYRLKYPGGRLFSSAEELSLKISEAKERREKSLFTAGLMSAVIPGSGYFYTEKYMLGVLSFLTNSALIYGIYDGYKKKDQFQMLFFSVLEFSFYNYSIVGSIKSADEYNDNKEFKKEVVLGFKTNF